MLFIFPRYCSYFTLISNSVPFILRRDECLNLTFKYHYRDSKTLADATKSLSSDCLFYLFNYSMWWYYELLLHYQEFIYMIR